VFISAAAAAAFALTLALALAFTLAAATTAYPLPCLLYQVAPSYYIINQVALSSLFAGK
jgi:hypothetical protein